MAAAKPLKLIITHPGRQHSHQAALALEKAGLLAGYWAGVPCLERQTQGHLAPLWRRLVRYAPVPLETARVRWFPAAPGLRRLSERVLLPAAAAWVDFLACRLFDRWAARGLARQPADGVIACEISALTTFRTARRLGMTTILDAPSIHHRAQDRLHGFSEPRPLHRRITRVKDLELGLADHLVTVSELARETYVEAGAAPERVHSVMLGADIELFTPELTGRPEAPAEEFTFLFAGAMIRRKGFDLLLTAFARVAAAAERVCLRVVGPPGDASRFLDLYPSARISLVGRLSQAALAAEMRQADCLVLPSRNDSYGMVVAEALACGLPVLVSEMVGAKDLVRDGHNGWIVPADDVAALSERMLWCSRHRDRLRQMSADCRRAAAAATWPAYHRRLAELVAAIVLPRAA